MKKLCIVLGAVACAICAYAALDTRAASATVVFPAQSVASGVAVTNAAQTVVGHGLGEISFAIGPVAAASSNRTVTCTLYGTNTVEGGWAVINEGSYKGAEAVVLRMSVACGFLPPVIKVAVGNTTAASVVSGVMYYYSK